VATAPVAELDRDRLVSLMVGRTLGQLYPPRVAARSGTPALSVTGLRPSAQPSTVTFTLVRGEILGLAGLEGQGQRGIIRAIAGVEPPVAGEVIKHDAGTQGGAPERIVVRPTIVSATGAGIGFVPEDRKAEGLYLPLSIAENMALGTMRGQSVWSRAHRGLNQVRALIERMRVVAAGPGQIVGSLSGGNQQKVMLGRWLASGVDVLLIEEPTRGVDVGAKAEIYGLLREFADAGGAVLLTSSELTEVLGLCDRILVVREGAVVGAFDGLGAGEEQIMRAALGGAAEIAA
jgi:ribose transport system ATP-binding protein